MGLEHGKTAVIDRHLKPREKNRPKRERRFCLGLPQHQVHHLGEESPERIVEKVYSRLLLVGRLNTAENRIEPGTGKREVSTFGSEKMENWKKCIESSREVLL